MPRYGTWRPVDRYQSGYRKVPMTPRRLILHTAVSNATPSMHSYFNVSGRATPHFYLGRDGELEQYIDTGYQSSANLNGNHDCITVESWDGYDTAYWQPDVPPWTDAQVEALARLAAWCYTTHGIPLVQLPSSRPGTRGVGWHRLGIDGNFPAGLLGGRVEGGERWSSATGKVCPGDDRIRQTVNDIIPRALALLNGEEDMPTVEEIARAVWSKEMGRDTNRRPASEHLVSAANAARRASERAAALRGQVSRVRDAVDALPEGATKAEVRNLLNNLDAEIQIVVNDTTT